MNDSTMSLFRFICLDYVATQIFASQVITDDQLISFSQDFTWKFENSPKYLSEISTLQMITYK